jgi:hypothetical protein
VIADGAAMDYFAHCAIQSAMPWGVI